MKLKRKGGLTAGIITLSAVALTSVGFAAWVISAGDTATVTGNIDVDEVTDHSHPVYGVYDAEIATKASANKKGDASSQAIKFGAPVGSSASSGKWLSNNAENAFENLTASFYVCVGRGSNTAGELNALIKVGFTVVEANESSTVGTSNIPAFDATYTGFAGARTLGMVGLPTTLQFSAVGESTVTTIEGFTSEDETKYGDRCWYKVDVAFSWGSLWAIDGLTDYSASATYALGALVKHAGHTYKCTTAIELAEDWNSAHWEDLGTTGNPYSYYNSMASNATISDAHPSASISASVHANKYLKALDTLLTGVSYRMTFATFADATEKSADTTVVAGDYTVIANSITA